MYCKKCGCEMKNDAEFCPQCGTAVKTTESTNVNSADNGNGNVGAYSEQAIVPKEPKQKQIFSLIIAIAGIQVLLTILWFTDVIVGSYSFVSKPMSMSSEPVVDIIMVGFGILSVFSALQYVYKRNYAKRRKGVINIISAVWSLFWIIAGFCVPSNGTTYQLTFLGVLFILCGVAIIILSFLVSSKTKQTV